MAIYTFLTIRSSNIIKRVKAEDSFDFIWDFFHDTTKNIVDGGIQSKSIYNMEYKVLDQKSRTKRIMYGQSSPLYKIIVYKMSIPQVFFKSDYKDPCFPLNI